MTGIYIEAHEHYALLRYVLETYSPSGTALEFGVGSGESTRIIAEHMPVIGYDSGLGLPEDWRPEFPRGSFAYGIPQISAVHIVEGWFEDTLPRFDFPGTIGLVHIDCDLYSSTKTVFDYLGPHLSPGVFIVFDEFHGYDGCELHEQRAWDALTLEWDLQYDTIARSFEQICFRITEIGSRV